MLFGIEFKRRTIDGEPWFQVKPHGVNATHVAIGIVVFAFIYVLCAITDVPPHAPTVDVGRLIR